MSARSHNGALIAGLILIGVGIIFLFENWYLVGDIVQIGDAVGRVEAVSIRHTQLRDEQGKLFIIPNGQIKTVTNFSKGFTLTQAMNDGIVDLVVGRRPFSDYDQIVKDWQANGGEQIRSEYQDSMATSA